MEDTRFPSWNVNLVNGSYTRKVTVENSIKVKLVCLGLVKFISLAKRCLEGVAMLDTAWKGLKDEVVLTNFDENNRCKPCAITMSERISKCMTDYGWKSARIVGVKYKTGIVMHAFCLCGFPCKCHNSERGKINKRQV